jgi:hypothetical protein
MSSNDPSSARPRRPLPTGYRSGIIDGITIFIGFSLTLLRFWAFEAPGDWTPRSIVAAIILSVPILLEIYVLFRSLRVADDDEFEYAKTVRWFIASVITMLVAVFLAAVVLSGALEPGFSPPSPNSRRIDR